MTIGELAERAGVRPSAIRYYERLGLLPAPPRRSGRRDYDATAIAQLAVVQFARATGCSLREAKRLVRDFSKKPPAQSRWRELADVKIKEIDALIANATEMKRMLERISTNCECETLAECGRTLASNRTRWRIEWDRQNRRVPPGSLSLT